MDGSITFVRRPSQFTTSKPLVVAIAAPATAPISACDEDVGRPLHQVTRFQVMAPTRPARIVSIVIAPGSRMPLPIVFATFSDRYAPTKLRMPAPITASRGEIERVATDVAIELAASWNPFVKSNSSAIATTMTSSNMTGPFPRRRDLHRITTTRPATLCHPPGYEIGLV